MGKTRAAGQTGEDDITTGPAKVPLKGLREREEVPDPRYPPLFAIALVVSGALRKTWSNPRVPSAGYALSPQRT